MSLATDAGATAPANEAVLSATIAEAPAVADTTSTETTTQATAAPDLDATLREVWAKHNPTRDPLGRFAARDAAAAPADGETTPDTPAADTAAETKPADQPAEATTEQAQTPAIEAPSSWSAEQKAKWASVPPDLQAYVAQRDKDAHEAISRAGQQIKAYEPIGQVLGHFRETFERNNLSPQDGVARLLAVEQWLGRDAGDAIKGIAEAYGVDLRTLIGQPAQTAAAAEGQDGARDPAVASLETALADTRKQLSQVVSHLNAQQRRELEARQASENEQTAATTRLIDDFARDKPHFAAVEKVIFGLLHSGAATGNTPTERLQSAYDMATHADPIRAQLSAAQRQAEEAKRTEESRKRTEAAKKASTVNVRSSTVAGSTPKTMDDTLREVARKHYQL
jgi:hypothetical protein